MKLKLYTADASKVSDVEVNLPELEAGKGEQALKQYLVAYMANQRQGNASTKTRSGLKGYSGKKMGPQKGSGRSRKGDKTSPIFRHGAVAHGPQPRSYNKKVNDATKRLAFLRALTDRAAAGNICLIERFDIETPSTKQMDSVIGKIAAKGKVLVVDDSFSAPALLSVRNIARANLSEADLLNPFDVLRYPKIVVSQKGFEKLLTRVTTA